MHWITDLIKHLGISKIFATAVFTTSCVLLFGHSHFPSQIPPINEEWKLLAVGAMSFSGVYLVVWLVQGIVVISKPTVDNVSFWWKSRELDQFDEVFILLIARELDGVLNLSNIEYDQIGVTRLEMIQKAKSLKKRGLVNIYALDEHIVSLTERGKVQATQIQARVRASSNSK